VSASRRRWIVFALGGASIWLAFVHRVAPVAIADELTRAFDISGAALGALAATYFYVYTVMQIPTGVLVDTLGPRRVLTAGGLIAGIGSLLFGSAHVFWVAALGRTLAGLGASVAFVALLKIGAQWFEERHFATVASVVSIIGLCGALSATVPLAWLITLVSWRDVFMAIGAVSLVNAVLTWRYAQERAVAGGAPGVGAHRWRSDLAAVLRNRATWAPFWVNFGLSGSYMCFIGLWLAPMLTQAYGRSAVEASQHASAIIIMLALSSFVMARVSDRLGRRKPVLLGAAGAYLVLWGLWLAGVPRDWTFAMCCLTGAAAPGFMFAWSLAKEVNPPQLAGMAVSVANTGGFLAAGLLQPLAGALLDWSKGGRALGTLGDFQAAMCPLALFALLGFAGALFVRETRCRNIWVEKILDRKR
jgi:MFS family permease